MSDLELLQDYARANSQPAFATLVTRHVNLVYSAAHRQVRSSQLAEEVTQSVFLDLARQAPRFPATQPLAAWLFTVTRRTAIDVVRRETRRQARETAAAEIAAMKDTPASSWTQTKEVLDEAMEALSDDERTALLLRFFESRSLREVGSSLGISEDTAQKRVSRALDRLRDRLLRRGVTVTAAGLAADLSAHALETAPAALTASLSTSAFLTSAALAPVTVQATQTVTLTVMQKAAAIAATAGVMGFAVYETKAFATQRGLLTDNATRIVALQSTLRGLDTAQTAASRKLKETRATLASQLSFTATDPAVESAIDAWLQRVSRLRQLAAERADLAIPELALLPENGWFNAAREARLDTDEQIREVFKKLRDQARVFFARELQAALTRYVDAHDGWMPGAVTELDRATSATLLPASLLARHEMLRTGRLEDVPRGEWIMAERVEFASPQGSRIYVGRHESGTDDLTTVSEAEFNHAVRAFVAAHAGQLPSGPDPLLPFLRTPPTASATREFLARPQSDFAPETLRKLLPER